MSFLIFRDFFTDFSEFISLFNNKTELKKGAKSRLNLRKTHVDATWHIGPRGNATRAHAARYLFPYIIYILYNA